MTTKRAYKLQEFVAHSAAVNCLKIGRKSSRVLVTGGEDCKVNLWAIGKPNAILSLSGHTSGIDSVSFDSSEVLVAAGAASGTIKLWDLEEAKIVRTLTGHRSNCISVDFHPFGEFFASGSLDTNLKIWDIRKKGCIHTYKGHTRGVNTIRFTPDGRWVVSGGEDHIVKVWDLTAGKLMHEFKCHEGQIQCLDFHPHEFLLATGSADRTVKFWDLETFELIGSAGPETTGVRCITFSPDGRTLLCGLQESLKVVSWEPIRWHDSVDVGWSRLSDLSINEGKLLGCSYNQSCVGVWVVDISRIEPYSVVKAKCSSGQESKTSSSGNQSVLNENTSKASSGRLSVSQNSEPFGKEAKSAGRLSVSQNQDPLVKETKSLGRLSVSQNSDPSKESKNMASTGNLPGTPQRVNLNSGSRNVPTSNAVPNSTVLKRHFSRGTSAANVSALNKSDVIPVIVPRGDTRSELPSEPKKEVGIPGRVVEPAELRKEAGVAGTVLEQAAERRKELGNSGRSSELAVESRKELGIVGRTMPFSLQSKTTSFRKFSNSREDMDRQTIFVPSATTNSKVLEFSSGSARNTYSNYRSSIQLMPPSGMDLDDDRCIIPGNMEMNSTPALPTGHLNGGYLHGYKASRDVYPVEFQKGGRMRPIVLEKRGESSTYDLPTTSIPSESTSTISMPFNVFKSRGYATSAEKEMPSASNEDAVADVMELHDQFISSMHSRLAKLQVVSRCWERNDVKGAIASMEKMADYAVAADVISIFTEKFEIVTLDICPCLLPLLSGLLGSDMDRHLSISLDMLLKLIRVFGSVIYSTVSAPTSVGVDIEAEHRLERCKACVVELEKVKHCLPALVRRGGSVAKSAQELNLALQGVS